MRPETWKKIKEIFAIAIESPAAERESLVNGQPPEISSELRKMISAHFESGSFIESPLADLFGDSPPDAEEDRTDSLIGPYRIVRELGRGGMGTVYLAERSDGTFEKPVALKLIKRGMDTSAVLRRFIRERSILARLQHPNIAGLLDGGTTADGLPYFVMEYIEGEPITRYCTQKGLSITKRLELFRNVCSAVSYAHQNLIVHRDLKPSNILVTEDGSVKLLDFGIAKLLRPDADGDAETGTMFRMMTPEYASPEQLRGEAITTASDVYSLGVVLFEVLCGRRPFDAAGRSAVELSEAVVTGDVPRPSSVVEMPRDDHPTMAAGKITKRTAPAVTSKALKGDLDNIVMMALRREPQRRYAAVGEMSEDVRRHLEGLPVTATKDSTSYRLRKFFGRHKRPVLAAAAAAMLLMLFAGLAGWQAFVARRERDVARQRLLQVHQISNKLLFDYNDRIKALPGTAELRRDLVSDAVNYLDGLTIDSGGDVALERDLINAYLQLADIQFGIDHGNIGNSLGALQSSLKAAAIAERVAGSDDGSFEDRVQLAKTYSSVAGGYGQTGDIRTDIAFKTKALALTKDLFAERPEDKSVLMQLLRMEIFLSVPLQIVGEYGQAEDTLRSAIKLVAERTPAGADDSSFIRAEMSSSFYLCQLLNRLGRHDEAMPLAQKYLELAKVLLERSPEAAQSTYDVALGHAAIGNTHITAGRGKDALEEYTAATSLLIPLAAKDEKNAFYRDRLADMRYFLALANLQLGRRSEAFSYIEHSIDAVKVTLAEDPSDTFAKISMAKYYLAAFEISGKCSYALESEKLWQNIQDANSLPDYERVRRDQAKANFNGCQN